MSIISFRFKARMIMFPATLFKLLPSLFSVIWYLHSYYRYYPWHFPIVMVAFHVFKIEKKKFLILLFFKKISFLRWKHQIRRQVIKSFCLMTFVGILKCKRWSFMHSWKHLKKLIFSSSSDLFILTFSLIAEIFI